MKPLLRFLAFVLLLSAGLGALSFWKPAAARLGVRPGAFTGSRYTVAEGPQIDLRTVDALAAQSRARIALAKAVVPSVVSITTTKRIPPQQRAMQRQREQLFHYFFGQPGANRGGGNNNGDDGNENGGGAPGDEGISAKALGSGVIVSKEGHILTNNHVVEGMDQFELELSDGRKGVKAKLIGTDPLTDLAVLKIEEKDIQALPFGDSDKVEVGETVIAIGNPFGLEETVTQGIISAKGRQGNENVLAELFQTDAAINPGNSGGALINTAGELIGINESIYSRTGGFQGIGFAIPSNVARRVMDGLLKNGRVLRGFLGVNLQPLTPRLAQQLKLPSENGALIGGITPGSPAAKADLKAGDFIVKFNGRAVKSILDLRRAVSEADVQGTVPVEVLRNGKNLTVQATLAEPPRDLAGLSRSPGGLGGSGGNNLNPGGGGNNGGPANVLAGVEVDDLSPAAARQLSLPGDVSGVVVTRVEADSQAADELRRGDLIEGINQQPVTNKRDFERLVATLNPDERVALNIIRNRARSFIIVAP